jgi:hypothetical protein
MGRDHAGYGGAVFRGVRLAAIAALPAAAVVARRRVEREYEVGLEISATTERILMFR